MLHELFLQVRNGVRRRKRRWDLRHFGGAGNVGGTCRFESCSVMLADIWVLKSWHAEQIKAPGLELFGSYITCGKNPQLRSTFKVITNTGGVETCGIRIIHPTISEVHGTNGICTYKKNIWINHPCRKKYILVPWESYGYVFIWSQRIRCLDPPGRWRTDAPHRPPCSRRPLSSFQSRRPSWLNWMKQKDMGI